MTIQRGTISLPEGQGPVVYVRFKKPRRPRKWKKRFFKLHGYNWTKNIVNGWMCLNDDGFYPSQTPIYATITQEHLDVFDKE
ncbi:MAG: hypothetical protein WC055_02035 [Melioribacteraceae bacterium]